MTEIRAKLREALGPALARARSLPGGPERSFWAFQPDNNFPPRPIQSPDEFDGSDRLCISCAQTGLPARAQKELLARWCNFLPGVRGVRYVWFLSKVSQELFDAACRVQGLEGLHVKWSSIDSLAPLRHARQLPYLRLGSSPAVADMAPISELTQLRWLELDNLKRVSDLSPLECLDNLEGLGFTGAEGRQHTVESLWPLAKLAGLRWLHLGSIHAADNSLRALGALKNLRWLGLGNFFPWEEFAWLAGQLPGAACNWFSPGHDLGRPGIRCKRCGTGIHLISGKSGGKLCPACDAAKFAAFSARFAALKARSAGA